MSQDWHTYPVTRRLLPHQPGAKNLTARYGRRLVCVRYRRNIEQQRAITTIEIVVDERPIKPRNPTIPPDTILPLKIDYHERELRNAVKAAGGTWDYQRKVWNLAYEQIVALNLTDRIVTEGS